MPSLSLSVDAMTSGTVVAVVVVADAVVAAVYLMVDVIEVPFAVDIPRK